MLARGGGAVWRTDIDSLGGLEALVSQPLVSTVFHGGDR